MAGVSKRGAKEGPSAPPAPARPRRAPCATRGGVRPVGGWWGPALRGPPPRPPRTEATLQPPPVQPLQVKGSKGSALGGDPRGRAPWRGQGRTPALLPP